MKPKRLNLIKESFDTLIILDACRFDTFEKIAYPYLRGTLEKRWSTAYNTPRWIRYQFRSDPQCFKDITVITGNSNYSLEDKEKLFKKFYHTSLLEFNSDGGYSPPWTIYEYYQKHKTKDRMWLHFQQPHIPFFNKDKKEIFREQIPGRKYDNIWQRIWTRELTLQQVIDGYEENLKTALPYVKKIIEDRTGKTIVCSTHGNLYKYPYWHFGVPSEYENDEELRLVPWLIIEG